jgi:general secretion pathway protein H
MSVRSLKPGRALPPAVQSGFTLLELLVVVVLISITVALVNLSARIDPERVARTEARRLSILVDHAVYESVVSGRPVAVGLGRGDGGTRIRFLTPGADNWVPIDDGDALRPRTLDQAVAVDYVPQFDGDGDLAREIALVADVDGTITPFVITVRGGNETWIVHDDERGGASMRRDEP